MSFRPSGTLMPISGTTKNELKQTIKTGFDPLTTFCKIFIFNHLLWACGKMYLQLLLQKSTLCACICIQESHVQSIIPLQVTKNNWWACEDFGVWYRETGVKEEEWGGQLTVLPESDLLCGPPDQDIYGPQHAHYCYDVKHHRAEDLPPLILRHVELLPLRR